MLTRHFITNFEFSSVDIWVSMSGVSAGRKWRNWINSLESNFLWQKCVSNMLVTTVRFTRRRAFFYGVCVVRWERDTHVDSSVGRKRIEVSFKVWCLSRGITVYESPVTNLLVRWIAALLVPLIYVMFALTFIITKVTPKVMGNFFLWIKIYYVKTKYIILTFWSRNFTFKF